MGSEGGFAAHPRQVERPNRVFTPSDEELAVAERIVAAAEQAERAGKGAVRLDDWMIDGPIVVRAEQSLERAKFFR
jgi:citrate lyase beta subunit